MAFLNNPVSLEIVREGGALQMLDVIPVYKETPHAYIATDTLRIYEGLPRDYSEDADSQSQRDTFLQNIELYGKDNPLFLGELQIRGNGLPDWRYHGDRLTENEIWQIVAALMQITNESIEEEKAIDAILNDGEEVPEGLAFIYHKGLQTDVVRIEESEGHFMVLVNEELTATIEMPDEVWEVTQGDIPDPDLRAEIISRINSAAR